MNHNIHTLNGRTVAVCIGQPFMRLMLPDGSIWVGASHPLPLKTVSDRAETVLGFVAQRPPRCTGEAEREISSEELATDAIFVPMMNEFVPILRILGFKGQILTPGIIRSRSEGSLITEPTAHYSTVVVLSDSLK